MSGAFKRLFRDDIAQDFAEYGIALAVISLGAGIAAVAIATNVSVLWSRASSLIAQVL